MKQTTQADKRKCARIVALGHASFDKIKMFELDKALSRWWISESSAAKVSLISALIIGFFSHLFVYTGRYYGRDDMGMIVRTSPTVRTGRWFNSAINNLSLGYVIPLVSGVFVTVFLALSAFYVCKLFGIRKRINGLLIAGLLSTFPSIANTNLFLYDTPNYHFAVLLGVLAVYITAKYKFGFLLGSIFSMLTLAIYQSKFNVVLALSLFYLIVRILDGDEIRSFFKYLVRFVAAGGLGAIFYALSLPISLHYYNATFNDYRGFSAGSIRDRLLSFSGLKDAIGSTYRNYFRGFFGNIYLIVDELKYAYTALAVFGFLFFLAMLFRKRASRQYLRLLLLAILGILVPFASNFSDFFDTGDAYGLMIYAFVFTPAFLVCLCDRCDKLLPILKSMFSICMVFVIANFIVGNNVYYLKAHYFNQRTFSLTTRVLSRIDPLIPLSGSNQLTFFGGLPNEYYPQSSGVFREYGIISEGSALQASYINYTTPNDFSLTQFVTNIDNMHGVKLKALKFGEQRDAIADMVLERNMPAWPAEGSVDIVDGVIVVNLGLTDIVFESDERGQYFRARHWISQGHAEHKYEYQWTIFKNGVKMDSPVTNDARLYIDMPIADGNHQVSVQIKNVDLNCYYPVLTMELDAGVHPIS